MFLTIFKSRWALISCLYTCLLEQTLCILPGSPIHVSTSYTFPFYAWLRSSLLIMQAFCHLCMLGRTIPKLRGGDLWKSASSCGLCPPGLYYMVLCQADPWTDKCLLSWCPGLWLCIFWLLPSLRILKSTISLSLQLRLLLPAVVTVAVNHCWAWGDGAVQLNGEEGMGHGHASWYPSV